MTRTTSSSGSSRRRSSPATSPTGRALISSAQVVGHRSRMS
jgi:hypothetical protein